MPQKPPTDRERLEALRDRLQGVIDSPDTSARDLATVAREYRIVVEKLAALAPAEASSALDEIANRRKKRGA